MTLLASSAPGGSVLARRCIGLRRAPLRCLLGLIVAALRKVLRPTLPPAIARLQGLIRRIGLPMRTSWEVEFLSRCGT